MARLHAAFYYAVATAASALTAAMLSEFTSDSPAQRDAGRAISLLVGLPAAAAALVLGAALAVSRSTGPRGGGR